MANHSATDNTAQDAHPEFAIQRIYLKDLSFESPNSPACFREDWKPEVELDLHTESAQLEKDVYEVVVRITVTTKVDQKNFFIAEVQQAGIFTIQGFPEQHIPEFLGIHCPSIIYPYAREVISDVIARGAFPPLYLAPISFEAIYAEQQKRQHANGAILSADGQTINS